jgi:eukaryotic-like serine/threonine-protein kinase
MTFGAEVRPGAIFDRYRLERRLGTGSFAEVWLAIEQGTLGFSKRVALKILRPESNNDQEVTALLMQEARLCGMLHHPRLVDVLGVGTFKGTTYVAMEYVDGMTLGELATRLKEEGLGFPTSVIAEIGIGIAEGLDPAHNATDHDGSPLGLVHRDLKPGNVMLSRQRGLKLTDFGLAKARSSTVTTRDGMLRGTPLYVAPEVWNGDRDFKPTVDLFALGVMLWELAVGEKLLGAPELVGIIRNAVQGSAEGDVQRLRLARPELSKVVEGLLQRDPEKRIGTAWEVREQLCRAKEEVDASGDLRLFLEMVAPLAPEVGSATDRVRTVDPTTDTWWQRLVSRAEAEGAAVSVSGTGLSVGSRTRRVEPPPVGERSGKVSPEALTRLVPTKPASDAALEAESAAWARPRVSQSGRYAILGLVGGVGLLLVAVLAFLVRAPKDEQAAVGGAAPAMEVVVVPSESVGTPPTVEPTPAPTAEAAEEPVRAAPTATPEAAPISTPAAPAPTIQPTPEPSVRPTPTPAPTSTPESVTPEPTPEPLPATPATGCLALVSSPPGAHVWLDGGRLPTLATTSGLRLPRDVGAVRIGMGIGDDPATSVTVQVEAGARSEVRCTLVGEVGCRVSPAGSCD